MKTLMGLFLLTLSIVVNAGVESREFTTPEQQKDYISLTTELRCLVCQNQTIADSNAELAADLRRQVYEMLQQGKSREDIVNFMTERYGDFVLYNPPFKAKTSLLWLGPVAFLLIGLTLILLLIKRKKIAAQSQAKDLQPSAKKLAQVRNLLEKDELS